MYSTLLFDLDGTLLDTLSDLADSVNYALSTHHLPLRSQREVRAFLGNGIHNLIAQSVPATLPQADLETVFQTFRAHYLDHCLDQTAPYPGVLDLLRRLQERGVKMGIISNKLQPAVSELNHLFFTDFIDIAIGESLTTRRKPHPNAVLHAMEQLNADPHTTLYVGDSEVDHATARAAGVASALVLWGFRDEPDLRLLHADHYLSSPHELLALAAPQREE